MTNKVYRLTILAIISILFISFSSSAVVTNSQDWTDVQAGMQYADEFDETPFFTRTADGSAVLNDIPIGSNVTVVQSSQNNYLPNLGAQIRTRDYNYNDTVSFSEGTELVPEDIDDFVVISEDRPSDVIVAAPLANAIEGWLLVVDDDNIDQVEQQLEDSDEVIKVGEFRRESDQMLDQFTTETITGENRFELSTLIADRIDEEAEVESVKLSGGRFLEASMFTESTPVLLTATNSLAQETEDYVLENTNIGGVVAIGAELGTVAEELDTAADNQANEVSVFVKYGQATMTGSREVQALSLFPLPRPSMNVRITAAQYLVGEGKLLATLQNPSEIDGYALNSIVVKDGQGETIGTVGDNEPRFLPADSSQIFSYDIEMDEQAALTGQAEFTTNYGPTPDNLDTFVDNRQEDIYGPPRILPIQTINLDDDSDVNISTVTYNPSTAEFNVTLRNSETPSYARVDLRNVVLDGLPTTLSSSVVRLQPNQTRNFILSANLSEEDIIDTETININTKYGERESFLINTKSKQTRLKVLREAAGNLLDSPIVLVLILIVLLLIIFLIYELLKDDDEN